MERASTVANPPLLTLGLPHEEAALAAVQAGAGRVAGLRRLVAFGSRVRGDFRGDSDLDILAIIDDIALRDDVVRFLNDIDERFDVPLSPVIYTNAEYEENRRLGSRFVENVEREGKVLYDALPR